MLSERAADRDGNDSQNQQEVENNSVLQLQSSGEPLNILQTKKTCQCFMWVMLQFCIYPKV